MYTSYKASIGIQQLVGALTQYATASKAFCFK